MAKRRVLLGMTIAALFAIQSTNSFAANLAPIYMVPSSSAVSLKVLATSGDRFAGTVIKGIPDGMGAMMNGNQMTLVSV